MKKKSIYLAFVVIALIVAAINLQSFDKKQEEQIPTKTVVEKQEYDPSVEIENTLLKFDSILLLNLKQSGTVGAAAVISYKGKIAYIKCFGVQKKGEKKPINKNTIFRLASVSKSITGVLAGILDQKKKIKLDDKVKKYLPQFELKEQENTENLTVRNLLSHTSGLIPHAYDLMVEDHVPLEKILEKLNEVEISAAPGEMYGYQNVMYSIYGPIVEKKMGKSFSEILKEEVFQPFEMNDASSSFEAFEKSKNKAFPHINRGNKNYTPTRLNDRYYNTTPAAGINASISDLGQFLAKLTDENSETISKKTCETIFTPQVNSPLRRTYFKSWGKVQSKQYALGWRIVNYKNRKVAYHGGFVTGYKSEIALCEEENIGIAILSNSPSTETAINIPAFLNMLFKNKDKLAMENTSGKQKKNNS